mgnify:CR=1 FL=1
MSLNKAKGRRHRKRERKYGFIGKFKSINKHHKHIKPDSTTMARFLGYYKGRSLAK